MSYEETLAFLFEATPMFQMRGGEAYKPGLAVTKALDAHYRHRHRAYKTILVGGTNGKGSVSHTLAAVLMSAGLRVGLFTSPHLLDFSERIRVDGKPIDHAYVVDFVAEASEVIETLHPSFFELTTMMAFSYFADMAVDWAIIEVGMGGRLDSTNIISPELSIITNVSHDHHRYLGEQLADIAWHKAGIIKQGVPAVVGRHHEETDPIFLNEAERVGASLLCFAPDQAPIISAQSHPQGVCYHTAHWGELYGALEGPAQQENATTLLVAFDLLREQLALSPSAVAKGFAEVRELTGLRGRLDKLASAPLILCDTAHNEDGLAQVLQYIDQQPHHALHIIFGMVRDKEVQAVLRLLPREANYYFTEASNPRALPVGELSGLAQGLGLRGASYPDVANALAVAREVAEADDLIFIGGSNFIVADLLRHWDNAMRQND